MGFRNLVDYCAGGVFTVSAVGAGASCITEHYECLAPSLLAGFVSLCVLGVNQIAKRGDRHLENKIDDYQ